jgi:hypothetical protein
LTITTTSRNSIAPPSLTKRRLHIDLGPGALSILGISLLTLWAVRKRRVLPLVPLGTLVLLLLFFGNGCGSSGSGGGGGGTSNPNGTPAGTYTITVTGSGSVSTSVTLTVT